MSENKTLHILRVEPGKAPEEKDIGSDLKSLQEEVGGLIECVYSAQTWSWRIASLNSSMFVIARFSE